MKPAEPGTASLKQSHVRWMVIILCGQAAVCFMRLWFLWDIWGGFVMALSIALGYYALREDLHTTLVCLWGFVNAYETAWDTLTGLISLVMFLVTLRLLQCLVIVLVPFAELLGALCAWRIFRDNEMRSGLLAPLLRSKDIPPDRDGRG
mmetsp:Transcript_4241/g.13572  ORF Transcript_4241/g.13572 Transcript_4241/m.13572 type:complete len:149 (-) Transcript_4241:98-544(-)